MIKIKNKMFNANKVISLDHVISTKNEGEKHYLLIVIDAANESQQKQFIEISGAAEFTAICQDVTNQLKNN